VSTARSFSQGSKTSVALGGVEGPMRTLVLLIVLLATNLVHADDSLDALYTRIAQDKARGEPLRMRVYVALCDNDSQGIVKVKNPAICDGDRPDQNIYWGTRGGLAGFMRNGRFRLLSRELPADGPIAVRALWRKRVAGTEVEIEGLAYRGREIRTAMLDFVRAAHRAQDTPHVVAYVGHNYFLDTAEVRAFEEATIASGTTPVGVLALSCLGDRDIRPYLTREGSAILLLNTNLTYPGAWSIGGLLEGLARRVTPRALRDSAARAFAAGMHKPVTRRAFAYGPKR
jgi:hypothetical protein